MKLSNEELEALLNKLLLQDAENEVFELKQAKSNFAFDDLGRYFSALSNEANLKGEKAAWLVFGVKDKSKEVCGTEYRKSRKDLDKLKHELAEHTTQGITFVEIHETKVAEKRVLMFQIPPAPRGVPVSYKGHYYGRDGESLVALDLEKIERLRAQSIKTDWSAGIVPEAGIADLETEAVALARANYLSKYPDKIQDAETWDTITFLNKAKLTIKGKITRTALILLGKEEAEHYLSPADPKIRWVLKDLKNQEKDYEIFSIPFLLSIEKVNRKIRNLKYRYIKDGTLFPEEVLKYEPFVIREALNNCIAHQDYEKYGRINVIEVEDEQLIFTNLGTFLPGSVEKVVIQDAPEETYRNPFLVSAMCNLKMVDTVGGGIKKIFNFQRERFFPMPDYDLGEERVKVTITGKVLDMDFARVLAKNPDLGLGEIMMLDKVQKKKELTDTEIAHLRKMGLVEGRKPNFFISSNVVAKTKDIGLKVQYLKQRGFDDDHYRDLIKNYIRQYGTATRKEIDSLLLSKLSDVLEEKQKSIKISNLLQSLTRKGEIINNGTTNKPKYVLIKKGNT